jgi:death-on-curing protein
VKIEPTRIDKRALLFLHEESLAMFGGARGMRDAGLLDSALNRPRDRFLYEAPEDLSDLAAAYGYGIAKNHAFVDGNKRSAFMAIGLFLAINGQRLVAEQLDAIQTMLNLAAGTLAEQDLAVWIRQHSVANIGDKSV